MWEMFLEISVHTNTPEQEHFIFVIFFSWRASLKCYIHPFWLTCQTKANSNKTTSALLLTSALTGLHNRTVSAITHLLYCIFTFFFFLLGFLKNSLVFCSAIFFAIKYIKICIWKNTVCSIQSLKQCWGCSGLVCVFPDNIESFGPSLICMFT